MRKVRFVPETALADDLLENLKELRQHMAVLIDEHRRVVGVVTLEDLIEEVVGEIRDEFDAGK